MSDNSPSIEDQVNAALSNIGEDGKLPEGLDPVIAYAANAEKRRRDTQSAYTKTNMRVKELEAENNSLYQNWEKDATSSLSASEQAELEELKIQDPDAWHNRLNELKDTKKQSLAAKKQEISSEASKVSEMEARVQALEDFNLANPGIEITDDVIENDIPPRITKQLAEGKISFNEFLDKCKTYLTKDKVIKQPDTPDEYVDLDKTPGGHRPSESAIIKADKDDYNSEIF